MNTRIGLLASGIVGIALASACSDDSVETNPHYTAGTSNGNAAGSPLGGEPSMGVAGNGDIIPQGGSQSPPEGGTPSVGGGEPVTPGVAGAGNGAGGAAGAAAGGNAGATDGGAPTVEHPPYDCVLHPVTHLEIINACTDAQRVEKHPVLPAIP